MSRRLTALCASSLAASSALSCSTALYAQATSINISRGPLAQSIKYLSEQTGISIGFAGVLPDIEARPVKQAQTAAEALRQLLNGSGYRAVRTGPSSFRIEHAPVRKPRMEVSQSEPHDDLPGPQIVVTAFKRAEPLSTLPATDRVLPGNRLSSAQGLPQTEAVVREIPSLSASSLGPGRNRLFIRGIGDGPLDGFNQGSVAVFLDEARLNYDAPDPDWALIDIHRVEVLEGPQGPLYGTGALGGILRISTNRPDPLQNAGSVSAGVAITEDGDVSDGQSAIINAALVPQALAVRAVAYRETDGGWINNAAGPSDSNRERLIGARLALTWLPAPQWTIDLTAAVQNRKTNDSQYVDGDLGPLERPNRLREPRDLDAKLGVLTVKGGIGRLVLTSLTSLSRQEAVAAYDATPLSSLLGTTGATLVTDARHYSLFDQEIRLQNATGGKFNWLAGASFIDAMTSASIVANDSSKSLSLLTLKRSVNEVAAYAEANYVIAPALTLGAGARLFSSAVDDEGTEGSSQKIAGQRDVRASGDASLTWRSSGGVTIYIRSASAYRPGGLNVEPEATQATYEPDELASVELGSRVDLGRSFSLNAALYATRWQHVQADELLPNGLVFTRNAGNARNVGLEGDVDWIAGDGVALTGGFVAQSARLERSGRSGGIDDPRLPAVPQVAARLKLNRRFRVAGWSADASVGFRYSGASHLSFDPALDRRTPAHGTVDASLSVSKGCWLAALTGDNLTNSSADTFAFGNPYRARLAPERTPLRPRTVGIKITRSF